MDVSKIKGIVYSTILDTPATFGKPDEETVRIAKHLLSLQIWIGSVAKAVLNGFVHSEFEHLEIYSEVLQDAVFHLLDTNKVKVVSTTGIILSEACVDRVTLLAMRA